MTSQSSTPHAPAFWTLILTSLASFMVSLDSLVVITALPVIHRDLGAGLATLQWTVNAYTLAFAAGITTAAGLADRFGRRRIFSLGLLLFSAASAASALSPNIHLLILARALQGLGAAVVTPLSLTILTAAFPAERRGTMTGIWGGITGLAVASGPLIGGAITQGLSWQWVFWVNVPIGLVLAVLAAARLAESFGGATKLDPVAVLLVSGGAAAVIFGLVNAGSSGFASITGGALLGAGLMLLVLFIAWEARAQSPMLPVLLFRNLAFTAANATGFFMAGAQFAAAFLVTQYFQLGLGHSPFDTGVRLLPWTATPLLIAPLAGALSDRLGRRPLMAAGMILQAAGLAGFALLAGSGYGASIVALVVSGIGVSMVLPTTPAAIMNAVHPQDMGKASAVNSTLQRFGSALGVAVATAVLAANGGLSSPAGLVAGLRPALAVTALLSVAGAVSALAMRPRRGSRPLPELAAPQVELRAA